MAEHYHFIGIGGIGMSALAAYCHAQGIKVSGSDMIAGERTDAMISLGIPVGIPHGRKLPESTTRVIITAAISDGNPELQDALARKLPVSKRAALLGELLSRGESLAVAGSHGKTTTTAMVTHAAIRLGLDPTSFIGGVMRQYDTNSIVGSGKLLIAEADEYDRSFHTLSPDLLLVTSLDHDHSDIYPQPQDLEEAFQQLMQQTRRIILHADNPVLIRLAQQSGTPFVAIGKNTHLTGAWVLRESRDSAWNRQYIQLRTPQGNDLELQLPLPGRHNAENALLVVAGLASRGADPRDIIAALEQFPGVKRRHELVFQNSTGTLMDDYAHHPGEIRALLSTLPPERTHVIFQPHTYTRTRDFATDFAGSLLPAHSVCLLPVYPAREAPLPGVESRLILEPLQQAGHPRVTCTDDPLPWIRAQFQTGDIIVTVGAGDLFQWLPNLKAFLQQPDA